MSIEKDGSGKRTVKVEVEMPGTVEEVWQAIATGPGVSAWFVPAEIEPREGGKAVLTFGPGMDSVATVTAYDPPHRYAAESDGLGPGAPPLATEWTVEARDGGKCLVRVVHSLFASTDDWDDQLTGVESGWPACFRVLRLYLTHFTGQKSAGFQAMAITAGPEDAAWKRLLDALNLKSEPGARWSAGAGLPAVEGVVEAVGTTKPSALLRLDGDTPGAVSLSSCPMGEQVMLFAGVYLYGEGATAAKERSEGPWQAWLAEQFPPAAG